MAKEGKAKVSRSAVCHNLQQVKCRNSFAFYCKMTACQSAWQRDRRHYESGSAQSSPCHSSGRTTLIEMIAIGDGFNIREDDCEPACAGVNMPWIKLGVIA